MNRLNRGYEFANLELGAPAIAAQENTNISNAPEILAGQAKAVEDMAAFFQKKSNEKAAFDGRLQALKDVQSGDFGQVDQNNLYGEAYLKTMQEGFAARAELDLRKGIDQAAIRTDTPEAFASEAAKVKSEVFGKLGEIAQRDPNNATYQSLFQNGQNVADAMIEREISTRRHAQREADIRAAQAGMAEVANTRISAAMARTRDFVINPSDQNNLAAGGEKQAALAAIIGLGPKTEFEINGQKFDADPSRGGLWNAAQVQTEIQKAEVLLFGARELATLEKSGDGESQLAYASSFAQKWRERPPELAWLHDDKAQDIEDELFKVANQTLGRERQALGIKKEDLSQLINTVQYSGRLSAEQIENGDALALAVGEPDVAQLWDNAKEVSRTGRRLLNGADISSVRGGAIPSGGYFGVPPSVHWGYATGGSGGRRRGGYHVGGRRGRIAPREGEALEAMDRGFSNNPIQAAKSHGYNVPTMNLANVLNINSSNKQMAINEIAGRLAFSTALHQETGAPIRAFANSEITAIKAQMARNPSLGIQLAANLSGLGEAARPVMAELGLRGTQRVAINMAAGGMPDHAIAGVVLGANGTDTKLSRQESTAFNRARDNFRQAFRGNTVIMREFDGVAESVKNRMLYDKTQGRVGNPAVYFNDAMGARRVNGEVFGGVDTVNRLGTVIPDWMQRGSMEQFMAWNANNFASKVVYGNNQPVRARDLRNMQLYYWGDDTYSFIAGWAADGSAKVLYDKNTGTPYAFDMKAFHGVLRRERRHWIVR